MDISTSMSLSEYMEDNGYDDILEMIEELGYECSVPALCREGCMVEPDGTCPHGNPSILIEIGMI